MAVPQNATQAQIKTAWRKIAKDNHPDLAGSRGWTEAEIAKHAKQFQAGHKAFELIGTAADRKIFDDTVARELRAIEEAERLAMRLREAALRKAKAELRQAQADAVIAQAKAAAQAQAAAQAKSTAQAQQSHKSAQWHYGRGSGHATGRSQPGKVSFGGEYREIKTPIDFGRMPTYVDPREFKPAIQQIDVALILGGTRPEPKYNNNPFPDAQLLEGDIGLGDPRNFWRKR